LVVGDVVSAFGLDNSILDFQPAAGVEVVVTSVNTGGSGSGVQLYNGTTAGIDTSLRADSADLGSLKFFVNNTNYLRVGANGAGNFTAFTGVQVG